ncbi:hypothetical protein DM806_21205 [Sphingobium lactosutens]|uniref:SRPBCC family protein n=1 Tax=Sphingobium lactosutens TaxID=522773 RepID=UPI0015BEE8B6|nr:SRPBCC family protein [Sphingobium lactosutens]NWK98133.1 hypothetical protein [Sphingobium lactosutens]
MSDIEDMPDAGQNRTALLRILAAIGTAFAFALGVYLLLEALQPNGGLISFSFLLILPAAITAFVTFVGDPMATRNRAYYMTMPLWLLGAVMLISIPVLKEGIICVVMLAPLWIASGMVGAYVTYRMRGRAGDGGTYCMVALALPLVAMQVEPMIPLPQATATVSRSVIVNASPVEIWPLLRGIPDVRPGDGTWTFTQDVLGVPRPIGAHMLGEGIGATRLANWGRQVRFAEHIIDWQPGRSIGWRFDFRGLDAWQFTDRHLMPDSRYFKVTTGGYRMEPIAPGRTRVTIDTRYWMQTPVNGYSRLWGEVFLGDIEDNLLALIRQRAERR